MSWRNVPRKENYFPLFAEDWNALVDAVDDLYYMLHTLPPPTTGGPLVGGYLHGDIIPIEDQVYSLGDSTHRFLNIWAKNIYGDPVGTIDYLNLIYNELKQINETIQDIKYLNLIRNELKQIKETIQDINILINSHLARELYDTYSYMIQFNYPSGVLELFSPKPKYQTIVRGWYAISTSSSGLAQMTGQYSLTPVGMIPLSVPLLSIPDIYLSLYYDESILLYYNNVTQGSYLQLILNIIEKWTGVTLRPQEIYPSGVDPTIYMPPSGWRVFFDFLSQSEIETPGWNVYNVSICQVANSMLTAKGIPGYYGYVEYINESFGPSRVVTTFRVRDVTGNMNQSIISYDFAYGSIGVTLALTPLTLNPDGTITTNLFDGGGGQFLVSNITLKQNTWYVLMYDFDSNTFSLLDTYGNVIASGKPTQISRSLIRTRIIFGLDNGVHIIDIDWIGIG
jgi:hypothetical protein